MDNIPATHQIPREVTKAGFLLIGSLFLGLITMLGQIMSYVSNDQHGLAIFLGVLVAAVSALTLFLVSKIKQRKNWARWVMFVAVLLSTASTIHSFRENWNESAFGMLLGCLTGLMDLVAVGTLFARRSNDWFANQLDVDETLISSNFYNHVEPVVTSMGYLCPHCGRRIAFLSNVVHAIGKSQACPYCNNRIKRDIAHGKFFALMFLVVVPLRILGKAIPALSFFGSPITSALITGLLIMFCIRFIKQDTST
jgi:DNA-directed RNA polymerase subunit RPC12/RpoP